LNSWNPFSSELAMDRIVRLWLADISHPVADQFFGWITHLGSPTAFTLGSIASILIFLWMRRGLQGLVLNLCLLTSWAVMNGLKELFGRPRPPGEHLTYAAGFSFPSGHAMVSTAFYGFLAYLLLMNLPGRWGQWCSGVLIILIILIGISRVYLNVHFASDVLAGFILGGLLVFVFARLYHYLYAVLTKRS
jgi:undecaprenyl-diphosphatase